MKQISMSSYGISRWIIKNCRRDSLSYRRVTPLKRRGNDGESPLSKHQGGDCCGYEPSVRFFKVWWKTRPLHSLKVFPPKILPQVEKSNLAVENPGDPRLNQGTSTNFPRTNWHYVPSLSVLSWPTMCNPSLFMTEISDKPKLKDSSEITHQYSSRESRSQRTTAEQLS